MSGAMQERKTNFKINLKTRQAASISLLMGRGFKRVQHWGSSTTTRNKSITTHLFWINKVNSIGTSLCFKTLKFVKPTPLEDKLLRDYFLYAKPTLKTDIPFLNLRIIKK